MNFQKITIALFVFLIAALGVAFYIDWRMSVQLRTVKAFVESYVFAEAVAACEKVNSTTPFHPPKRKASVSRISESHSCAVHGAPGIEWLNGSARGTAPWAKIHWPVAICDQVSPSPSTWGE